MAHMIFKAAQVIFVCLFVVFLSSLALAQGDTGSIVGTVRDNSGAVVTAADVKVTNIKTGRVLEVKTSDAGEYSVPGLPAALYKVEASHSGFETGVVADVVLNATATRAVDVTLKVGAETQNVTVVANAVAVNTQTSGTGGTIDGTQVENLPLNGRDFTQLIGLMPGAVTNAPAAQQSVGGYESFLAGVNVLLDGADATRIDTNATSTQLGRQESRISRASVDSIAEFEVMSGTYSAEYGRSSGDVINIITKSGGNDFHGTLFEFFRNDGLDAKNYFETIPTALHLNQFGGNLGGPIVRNKLFFFMNYEGVRQSVDSPTGPIPVMTAATKAMAVPAMAPIVALLPDPNPALGPVIFPNPGGPPIVRNDLGYFEGNLRNTIREDTGSVKVDYNYSSKDSFAFRYNIADSFTSTQYGIAANQISPSPGRNQLLKGTWNHIFTPSVLNEFGVAFNRPWTDSLGGGGNLPIFQCSAFWGCAPSNDFGAAPGPDLFSSHRPQHSLQFLDTVSWTKGRHGIRAGLDIRHAVTEDALFPQSFIAYDGISDFLANQGEQFSTLGHNLVSVQNTDYSFFFQDDFRIAPRLTLNLGLRYDYFSVLHGDLIQNFNVAAAIADPNSTTANFGTLGAPLYKPDRNNFAPRIGFAWDPRGTGKTVVRGGFGVFYNPALTGAALSLAGNYQQGYNVNFISIAFGLVNCTPAFGTSYYISVPLPNPLPVCTPTPPPNVSGLDPNMRDTYTMHWSLGVQQELARNTIMEIAYVGNRGVKLPAGAAYAGEELNLSPFGGVANANFGNVRRLGNFVNSNYNSLQASLKRHMAHGLNLDASYTWSHETDDGINILLGAYQNSNDPKADYASGDIDVRHNFTLAAVWDVPVASSLPGFLAKGWQMTSLVQARSGLPVNIALAAPFLGIDQLRPNLVAGQSITPSDYRVPSNQFNLNAFAAPGPFQYGNLGRNAGRGPGYTQVDIGLSKIGHVTERTSVQFGGQMFNVLNHPNFNTPDGYMSDANFGKSTSTVGNQVGPGTSRQVQLFAKFIF